MVHVTGYGVKLGNWIFPKSIIHRGICKIRKLINQVFGRETEDEKLRKNLFDLYEFDREDDEGRWLRIILKVEK